MRELDLTQQAKILVEWNATQLDYPGDRCFHQLFEAQARQTPHAVAAAFFKEEQLTYQELDQRANQLAHHLQRLGVGPEVLVGVSLERSLDLVVAFLGILKAGGVYVPFDPDYPAERLAFLLQDTQAPILLTHTFLRSKFSQVQSQVLFLDADWPLITQESAAQPESPVQPFHLAYVIYTSGSTGQPKGVMIQHRSLCNFAEAQRHVFHIQPDDRILQFASASFDASIFEIVLAFYAGACLCFAPRDALFPGATLEDTLDGDEITGTILPPTVLALLRSENLPMLRTVISGGEKCPEGVARRWSHSQGRRFFNAYGPTEVTIWATVAEYGDIHSKFTIGHPVANTQIYILDQQLHPVSIGVPGELYIGGAGLARGYLNRPELTAEKFIAHPFKKESDERLYRSGDIACFLPDGSIEFLGRLDRQIKLHGLRIELEEIEAALDHHPGIQGSAVLLREDTPGHKRLVAYLILAPDHSIRNDDIRLFLQGQLPHYMLPSSFVRVEQLPLTRNGKLDRQALLAPQEKRPHLRVSYVAPRNAVEELLVGVWIQVLKIDRVGVHDNFFDLGGSSLLAIHISAQMRTIFHIELSLSSFFECATIAALAEQVAIAQQSAPGSKAVALKAGERPEDVPFSFGQESLWIVHELNPGIPVYNVPLVLRLRGILHVQALEKSLQEISRRHEILSTAFVMVDEQLLQAIGAGQTPLLFTHDFRGRSEAEWKLHIMQEHRRCFALNRGPLVHIELLKLREDEHILFFNFHHIIVDGWSTTVLFEELAMFYTALVEQTSLSFTPLPIQYADYALWQREYLRGEVLEELLSYWQARLHNAPLPVSLPTDRPRPIPFSYRGATHRFYLSSEISIALSVLSHQQNCTVFMTLLVGVQMLLARANKQDDIAVGMPSANRLYSEFEPLIGYFVDTLVLRIDLSGNPTIREVLTRAREVTLGAYAHQMLPFELLVQHLKPKRDVGSSTPFFRVIVQLRPPLPEIVMPHLQVQQVDVETEIARFDLDIAFEETTQGLKGTIEYNTDLFNAETIHQAASHLQQLFNDMTLDPERRLTDLPSLAAMEKMTQKRQKVV